MKIYNIIFGGASFEFISKYDKEKTVHFLEQTVFESQEITGIQVDGDFKIWSKKLHPIFRLKFGSPRFVIKMNMKNIEKSSKINGVVKMDDVVDFFHGFGIFMGFVIFGLLIFQPEIQIKLMAVLLFQITIFSGIFIINRSYIKKGIHELDKIRNLIELQSKE